MFFLAIVAGVIFLIACSMGKAPSAFHDPAGYDKFQSTSAILPALFVLVLICMMARCV
jgi:hypothetical protein